MTDKRIEDIITDAEMSHVHANADFGNMTPRDVLKEGVKKVSDGYHCGYTMTQILIQHNLVGVHRNGRTLVLTVKGKQYLAATACQFEVAK